MSAAEAVEIRAEEYDRDSGCEPLLLFWYVGPGQAVTVGQELCEVESAKAVVVITAPASGVLSEVLVQEGEAVGSGQLLGRIIRPKEG
jgi:pyruvate/2-oxoglutarate dehydrogenase complex dihydrolipoamide acyltransferase (E2) component